MRRASLTTNGSGMTSIQGSMNNRTWNLTMSDDGRVLQMRLQLLNQQPDQLKITLNHHDLRVETIDQQGSSSYRHVTLPKTAQLNELKCFFDSEHRRPSSLNNST